MPISMNPRRILPGVALSLTAVASTLHAQPGGGGTPIKPGESCPPGMTEIRPLRCLAPRETPPSILDYRPKSMLVVPEHKVQKAKYPVIDFHGHPQGQIGSVEALENLRETLDGINVRLMIAANNISGDNLKRTTATVASSPTMKDRVRIFTGIPLGGVGPGWAERAVAQLEADVAAGAVGIGEVGKGFGQTVRKADGSRLRLDDPDLKPVWDAAARLNLPVFIHTADPPAFYLPHDFMNERWLEMALFPGRAISPDQHPNFEELMTERDNLFRSNPKTTFVAAHMGWHTHDLGRLGKMLDAMPNLYVEMGAVLYDIGRQPRVARDFFIKYQDRILFGKDSFQPEEYPYYWRVFETRDDYFDYYRDYHAFWKLYGIDLPDEVLKKVYYKNALKITPRLPQTGWPR
ncbi:MAG TPA: amidohydrolase family protein [Gemmatimonadaceae bacterium]|nr:amidohydrolase family protein [Gemmatimonadaceae bacterium]